MCARCGPFENTRFLPVPSPVLDRLLEEIRDVEELKCTLRFFWHVAQRRAGRLAPERAVEAEILERDEVLVRALGSEERVGRGLAQAVARGTLLMAGAGAAACYLPNDAAGRSAAARLGPSSRVNSPSSDAPEPRPGLFRLYEDNIGMLTPLLAEELREAQERYPDEWLEAAFREAVAHNVRSWRYVARILERWARSGPVDRGRHGKSGRHTATTSAAEYVRRRQSTG